MLKEIKRRKEKEKKKTEISIHSTTLNIYLVVSEIILKGNETIEWRNSKKKS